jgi:hypothetical protein
VTAPHRLADAGGSRTHEGPTDPTRAARASGALDARSLPGALDERRFERQRRQAVTVIAVLAAPLAAFGVNDYFFAHGDWRQLAGLLAARAVVIGAMVWVGVSLMRSPDRERFERTLFTAMIVGTFVSLAMHFARPRDAMVVSRFELLTVVGFYVAMPLRHRRGAIPALLLSTVSVGLALFWHQSVTAPDQISITICFGLANVLGFLIGRQRELADDEEELAWRAVTTVNANLRKTLGELRALRSVVPVCPVCRKVRGSNESWQQLEAYVAEREDITFSPIVCPECLQQQFGAVLAGPDQPTGSAG